jgi:flavin reductase (DIM6/NTAB) family NADH-FMN oxidoreductase RutF
MLVISKNNSNEWNIVPVQWFTQTSLHPPMFAVSIGHSKISYECFNETDEFNLCIPKKEMKEKLLIASKCPVNGIGKFRKFQIEYFYGRWKRIPIIKQSLVAFECKYVSQIKTGDHTLFIGECKYTWMTKSNNSNDNYT